MESLLNTLSNNPFLNVVFLCLAIFSILLSVIFYLKSKKTKDPSYLVKSYSLIENHVTTIDGLEILFNDKSISCLTLTKLSLWNNGRQTIDRTDIAPADKLRIELTSPGEIISAKATSAYDEANNIDVVVNNNSAEITFDFLDYGNGAIFQIYHTCASDQQPELVGTLKGANKIKYGKYKELFLTEKVLHPFDLLFENLKIDPENGNLGKVIAVILLPVVLPIVFIFGPIDAIAAFMKRAPKLYELSDESTESTVL